MYSNKITGTMNDSEKKIDVERLDLFLFPSQLLHQSPKNISNDLIMTLSFNCF